MPREHPKPTKQAEKELYGSATRCAFPRCPEPLYKENRADGRLALNSRVAHICARREGGPRWDPAMTALENQSASNLILLCVKHADEVDIPKNLALYTVDVLRGWKADQLRSSNARDDRPTFVEGDRADIEISDSTFEGVDFVRGDDSRIRGTRIGFTDK